MYKNEILEHLQDVKDYNAWLEEVKEYNNKTWFKENIKSMFVDVYNPNLYENRKTIPHWYPRIVGCGYNKIGNRNCHINIELRYWDGFFLAMAEETPDGVQFCEYNLDGSIEACLGGRFAHSRYADEITKSILIDLKSVIG